MKAVLYTLPELVDQLNKIPKRKEMVTGAEKATLILRIRNAAKHQIETCKITVGKIKRQLEAALKAAESAEVTMKYDVSAADLADAKDELALETLNFHAEKSERLHDIKHELLVAIQNEDAVEIISLRAEEIELSASNSNEAMDKAAKHVEEVTRQLAENEKEYDSPEHKEVLKLQKQLAKAEATLKKFDAAFNSLVS